MIVTSYLPILLFIVIGIMLSFILISIGKLLGPYNPNTAKNSSYECGFEAFKDARIKFDVRYYIITIIFIIFDLETVFLFPWGITIRELGLPSFLSMLLFIFEFILGFTFLWRKGALEWK